MHFSLLFSFILVLDNNTINTMKENISPILLNFPQHSTEYIEVDLAEDDLNELA